MSLLLGIGFLLVVMGAALVLNWAFLCSVHQSFQDQLDAMAWTSVGDLLDDGVLEDDFTPDQADDLVQAEMTADVVRQANNDREHKRLHIESTDLEFQAGRVENVTQPATKTNFQVVDPILPGHPRLNTLVVHGLRDPLGSNRVEQLIRGFKRQNGKNNNTAEIESYAYATLDSRVVGYKPTDTMPAPLVPLAIDQSAWYSVRVAANIDTFNGNGRKELWLELKFSNTTGVANAALIGVNGVALVTANIPSQVTDTIYPADLAPATEFGPLSSAGAGRPGPVVYPGTDTSPLADTAAIATAFDTVANDPEPARRRRVFPIYTSFVGPNPRLEGYIAATILDVDLPASMAATPRLRVLVEPEFYIHVTATTNPAVDENPYVHKVRLTR